VRLGDLIIGTAAVRFDGASRWYAPPEYPAAAHWLVVRALVEAAESLGVRHHVGVVASTDSFYVGQERPGYGGFMPPWSKGLIDTLRSLRVLSFEMERPPSSPWRLYTARGPAAYMRLLPTGRPTSSRRRSAWKTP